MNLTTDSTHIHVHTDHLAFFEALASDVRIKVIHLLARKGDLNIKNLADELGLSSAIMSMHIKKLEAGGLIHTNIVNRNGTKQKVCTLADIDRVLVMPKRKFNKNEYHEVILPIGHYTDMEIHPTCGIATKNEIIGEFDNPIYFMDPKRMNAQILWFGKGYLEYTIPNFITNDCDIEEISISLELSSEAPGYNDNWPSDITFFVNGKMVYTYTSAGEFGDRKGIVTPNWWYDNLSQYGLLKTLRINHRGTFIDGMYCSGVTIDNLNLNGIIWKFRISVLCDAINVGGLTLFGKEFGNYPQDIIFRVYYKSNDNYDDNKEENIYFCGQQPLNILKNY